VLPLTMSLGMTLFALDFGGAGLSNGEHISLGWWEREDLAAVIAHLRTLESVSTIALWGRSMGAVTALLHADRGQKRLSLRRRAHHFPIVCRCF
jgi:alpha/beta superfamily hydrolase